MKGYNHVSQWYDSLVQDKGHYYHENIIIPKVLAILKGSRSVLDLACGQGVLQRKIDPKVEYLGIDISDRMIHAAVTYNKNKNHRFLTKDLAKELILEKKNFEVACIILSLQDIENPSMLIKNASNHLKQAGKLIIVINHPCFRIPRQSSWGTDEKNKIQYRRVDKYMSEMKVPINVNPSQKHGQKHVFAHHFSISVLSKFLQEHGFLIEGIEEWVSDKTSEGGRAKMENRSREEFPLFMGVIAIKK